MDRETLFDAGKCDVYIETHHKEIANERGGCSIYISMPICKRRKDIFMRIRFRAQVMFRG